MLRRCNLAACHNYSLLPETCCEESNMLLDRALLIGTLDNPEIGSFNFIFNKIKGKIL